MSTPNGFSGALYDSWKTDFAQPEPACERCGDSGECSSCKGEGVTIDDTEAPDARVERCEWCNGSGYCNCVRVRR